MLAPSQTLLLQEFDLSNLAEPDPLALIPLVGNKINSCNGRKCGETFAGPNSPDKPAIWTENWTSFYRTFGQEPSENVLRTAEDIAYHTALFIANKNGSYINYYMYHGGTNFGRTAAAYMTTSYYDLAPLDEYGLASQPKWGHLKELHAAVKLVSEPLLQGTITTTTVGQKQQAYVFEGNLGDCAAFLINTDLRRNATVTFRSAEYLLLPLSISILQDCKNEIFNTAKVSTQMSKRLVGSSEKLDVAERWQAYKEVIPNYPETQLKANELLQHMATTKDASDYLWYTCSFEHSPSDAQPVLHVFSFGHVVHAYINNVYIGNVHGSFNDKSLSLQLPISLNNGTNNISILSVMVGAPDSGAHLENRVSGLRMVWTEAANHAIRNFSSYSWGYQVGLLGEMFQIYTEEGSSKVQWSSIGSNSTVTWYKTMFDSPLGVNPVVLNLGSMGKGEAWINGQSIGRYWPSFYTSEGNPSQTLYHVPRSFLKSSGNLLVLLEELSGNPLNILVDTISTG